MTLDMTSRYLGLIAVPGQYVKKIEVEEFVSQMKGRIGEGSGDKIGGEVEGDEREMEAERLIPGDLV